jgi:hypothetical protein
LQNAECLKKSEENLRAVAWHKSSFCGEEYATVLTGNENTRFPEQVLYLFNVSYVTCNDRGVL